jgi:hypothetical protein
MGCCDACGNVGRLAALRLTAAGVVLQSWAAADCKFLYAAADGGGGGTALSSGFGLFRAPIPDANGGSGDCQEYTDEFVRNDSMLYAAQIMIVLAACFAFCAGCLVAFEWVLCKIPCAGCIESLGYSLALVPPPRPKGHSGSLYLA